MSQGWRWKFVCHSRGLYARFCTPCHQGCVHTSAPNNKLVTLICTQLISTPLRHCERMKNGTLFWIQRTEKKHFVASICGHCPLDMDWTTNCRQITIKVIASDWEHSTMVKLAIELYWPSEHLCYPSSDTTEPIWTASIANRQQRTPKYIVQTYEFHEVKSRATYYGSMLELEECFLGVYSTLETCRPPTCEQQWSNAFNT